MFYVIYLFRGVSKPPSNINEEHNPAVSTIRLTQEEIEKYNYKYMNTANKLFIKRSVKYATFFFFKIKTYYVKPY